MPDSKPSDKKGPCRCQGQNCWHTNCWKAAKSQMTQHSHAVVVNSWKQLYTQCGRTQLATTVSWCGGVRLNISVATPQPQPTRLCVLQAGFTEDSKPPSGMADSPILPFSGDMSSCTSMYLHSVTEHPLTSGALPSPWGRWKELPVAQWFLFVVCTDGLKVIMKSRMTLNF